MGRAVKRLGNVEHLAVVLFCFLIVPPLLLHGAEVDQILGDERVPLAVERTGDRQDQPVQRIGDRKVPRVVVRVRELAHARGQVRTRWPPRAAALRSPTACSSTLIPASYCPLSSSTCPSATVALAIAG